MGVGRTGYRALGIAPVKQAYGAIYRFRVAAVAGLAAVVVSGCSSIGGFTGAAAGVATGAFTANPAIGVGVGVTVQAATDAAVQRVYRDMQDSEQTLIAEAAGNMAIGETRAWATHYSISFFDEHGEVRALDQTSNALTTCREVAFSVISGKDQAATSQWFVTQVCRASDAKWRWAAAEPATGRWGSLH